MRHVKLGIDLLERDGNGAVPNIKEVDGLGFITKCECTAAQIPNLKPGYQIGCELTAKDTGAKYTNTGTVKSCVFSALGNVTAKSVTAADIALADGKILVGGSGGASAAQSLSGDVTINDTGVASIVGLLRHTIADPGNAGAIPVTGNGTVPLVTAGAETRTLAAPSFIGQLLQLSLDTYVGACVITVATLINHAGNNTITMGAAGENIVLVAKSVGGVAKWSVLSNDGAALSTV